MQLEPSECPEHPHHANIPSTPPYTSQHGLAIQHPDSSDNARVRSAPAIHRSCSASPRSVTDQRRKSVDVVNVDQLEEKLRGLSFSDSARPAAESRRPAAGQRVSDYENALTPPVPRQAFGFKVIRRADPSSNGAQLADFPNEILTQVLSHLHPDSHGAVALVSKRFYALVTTPHTWRMAFMRYFPAHTCLDPTSAKDHADIWAGTRSDIVRSDIRYFGRLTPLATWRSEYLFRTRLIRSLARGKPGTSSGDIGSSDVTGKSAKRKGAVLTYNSKLPWLVTNIHAVFSNGNKPPRAIQGVGNLGVATVSDPSTGKVEKWGLQDPFSSAQLEEIMPHLVPYGLGDGPVMIPNTMDVSQPYGIIAGEGFPGGRAYFRGINEACGRYLSGDMGTVDTYPDVPKIPELSDTICSVWIAKSSAVPASTQAMCGMLTGSALGVVTAYALGWDSSGPRFRNGDMTARWVVSPGVPIISLQVDEKYSIKRRSSSRVWAVALNALGEVFYLTETPVAAMAPKIATLDRSNENVIIRNAWLAGRTAYWHLVEPTRRAARPDARDKYVIRGAYTPRSPSNDMKLSKDQLAAEAREIEKFLLYKPSYFRKVCEGWDMQRRLEVDFAADDGRGAGESVFVIDCGHVNGLPGRVRRFSRLLVSALPFEDFHHHQSSQKTAASAVSSASSGGGGSSSSSSSTIAKTHSSLFGIARVIAETDECHILGPQLPRPSPTSPAPAPVHVLTVPAAPARIPTPVPSSQASVLHGISKLHDWESVAFELKGVSPTARITSSCLESSSYSLLTLSEDPLHTIHNSVRDATISNDSTASPTPSVAGKPGPGVAEVPGRRARILAVGTNEGAVIAWNARHRPKQGSVHPVRALQTDSPEISCLAASALYLVHGGSDGLVQAWDPLASTTEPIRTLHARASGRVPRHMAAMNPSLRQGNCTAVGAIFLDPDPTVLRGLLSVGAFLRYWTYSSSGHPSGRKRRVRHSDIHGRVPSRRLGGTVSGYIAAEEAELRRENEARVREQAHLRRRFGVGALGDLTEEEALRYAQIVSEEAYLQDEQRRASDSAADVSVDTASSYSEATTDTVTPEASVSGTSPSRRMAAEAAAFTTDIGDAESNFEQQIQQAIRLSLLEGVNDTGESSRADSPGGYDFPIKMTAKSRKKNHASNSPLSPHSTHYAPANVTPDSGADASKSIGLTTEDADYALALSLSMQEQDGEGAAGVPGLGMLQDEFPPLDTVGVGKGKGVARW
ncbi:hypothetical protein E4U21_001101 [Claviceps maximensis]|nr:hypothetical protein E4U21_001101 [Claviceps maximensis]